MSRRKTLDPAKRARQKQASRDADAQAIASGEKTREQLAVENSCIDPELIRKSKIDYSKMGF